MRRSSLVPLRTAWNLAVKRGHLPRNAAALIEQPKQARTKRQPPKVAELRRLLDMIRADRMQALVYVALGASLRRAEVLGLHWEDVDLEGRTLTVRRRVNRVGGKGGGLLVREGAKSESGERIVVMPTLVVQALKQHRKYQLEDYLASRNWKGADYSDGQARGFIFTSEVGTVLEPRKVDLYSASVRGRAGLDGHTFHGLRHDFAGLLLAGGISGRVVMEMVGQADYSITAEVYQHVPDELQRICRRPLG